MTAGGGLDRMLGAWFEQEASAGGAATLLEATLDQTRRRRPRPAWAAAVRNTALGLSFPAASSARARLAYVALILAAVLGLVIGAILVAGRNGVPPAPPRACVGDPPNLCGHGAGRWASAEFLPGLALTLPDDNWYTRDVPDHLELKTPPMTSLVEFKLDPIPRGEPWEPDPDTSGTRASLAAWMSRDPDLIVARAIEARTGSGLPVSSFDLTPVDPGACAFLFVGRDDPGAHASVLDLCHYTYRWHLVDIGDGHTLSVLLTALDSDWGTLNSLDAAFAPILDSISPPATIGP